MNTLELQIKAINDKLQQLLRKNALLQRENEHLNIEVKTLKEKDQEYKATIETISQKINILQIASGNLGEREKKELEKRINHYVKEIDKCISILSE